MTYIPNPDSQPGKKNAANFNAIENQGIGNGVIPFYGNGTKYLVPMKNVSKASKDIGILGSEGACKPNISHRAGVSSDLDEVACAASSEAYNLNAGLVREFIELIYNSEEENLDRAIPYVSGHIKWFKFTMPSGGGGIALDIYPKIDNEFLDDADVIHKMSFYTGTEDNLVLRDWDSPFTGGAYINTTLSSTTYYIKVFGLPSGSLSIKIIDD
jgi:hypothetical protein